jgi:hypothetical protein
MLITAPSRRWQVTESGVSFLNMDPILQTGYMLTNWWFRINWVIAFPVSGLGDSPPRGFETKTLAHLRALRVGQQIPFEPFADKSQSVVLFSLLSHNATICRDAAASYKASTVFT